MTEVKDKIVTIESLSALHNYNKNNYVSLTNDQTISGTKTFSGVIKFSDSNTNITPSIFTDDTDTLKIAVKTSGNVGELYWMGSDGNFSSSTNGRFIGEKNLSTYGVTGIKGNSESSYRKGDVNITIDNLGLKATTTELNYCSGITGNIQTQLNNKASLNHTHQNLHHPDYASDSLITIGHDSDGYWFRPTNISNTGNVYCGSSSNPWHKVFADILTTYDTSTTSSGVDARIYNDRIYRAGSSSKRYKENIEPIKATEIAPEKLYDAEVVQFTYKDGYLIDEDPRNNKLISGFIVEDLEKVYPIAVDYNDNGEPEMWNVNIIVPSMLKLIQEQKKEIDKQQKEINILKEKVGI